MKKLIFTGMLTLALAAQAVNPLWVRDVRISPKGDKIAFSYKGAIYSVPSTGGKATRLTSGDAYHSAPVWSPDGSKIAYSTDVNGGADVYIMDADGAHPTRLTYNSAVETPEAFSADGKDVIFSASIYDPASSVLFPGYRANSELYSIPAAGGRMKQLIATPAVNVELVPGSDLLVFEGVKGGEDKWRKHHTSSVTRDLWTWDSKTGQFTNITDRAGEDRDPAPSADGKTLYFLSERNGGSFNVYEMSMNGGEAKKITDFKNHPVRFLSSGANGLLAFTYNGELYTMKPGSKPAPLAIDVTDDAQENDETLRLASARGAVVSPDGEQVAFTNRGELFVTSTKYPSTKQITETAAIEEHPTWSKDGRTLYYTTYRTGHRSIYKAEIERKDDPNFSNATLIKESPVFSDDKVERSHPSVSPDGKKLAYVEDRNILKVMDLKTGKSKTLTPTPPSNSRSGGIDVAWSPDSKWVAIEANNPKHEPYSDIAIINTEDGERIDITRTGYFDQDPKWSPDGKAILFNSDRYGMRSHASWGSEYDVMMVFLTRDAYDRYRLSEEDFALLKEVEKEQKKASEKNKANAADAKNGKGGKGDAAKADAPKEDENAVKIDRDGLQDRIVRLTPASSPMGDFALSKDGETLYYISQSDKGQDLWKKNLRKGDVTRIRELDSPGNFQTDAQGNLWLTGSKVGKLDPANGSVKPVSIAGTQKLDKAAEREAMFDYMVNEARERFLLPKMPVDWNMYAENYRKFLPHINNNYDFQQLLSEILGELNVSHSGGRYTAPAAHEATASLGLIFDVNTKGDGLRIDEIVEGGPFDRVTTRVRKGDIITAINGVKLSANADWTSLFNGIARKKTLVSFSNPKTGEKWDEVVLPISSTAMNNLLYERWIKTRAAAVDSLSGGRLGYVHIKGMNDESFRKVYAKLLGEYVNKDGIVIDTRFNGGGRLHEDIEVLFSGEKYLTQEIHGRESSDMPSRRWNKPSIMITGEANYSNAHGTPWVYKKKNLGKVVGMPVPGTMSSVNWITMQDPTMVFGIPVTAFRTAEGNILENTQLEPDVKVANAPQDVVRGIDTQLETAVRELLRDIDAKKK